MKKSRKFESLLQDMRQLLDTPAAGPQDMELGIQSWRLIEAAAPFSRDTEKIRSLLEVARAVRTSSRPSRQTAERNLTRMLAWMAGECSESLADASTTRRPNFEVEEGADSTTAETLAALRELYDFAIDCLDFVRSRDSFSGERRALALEILGAIGKAVDLPEIVLRARKQLRNVKSIEARAAAEMLMEYFRDRELPLEPELANELLSMAERTDSRSNAVSALNALVETGAISEWGALDRLDTWKERQRG